MQEHNSSGVSYKYPISFMSEQILAARRINTWGENLLLFEDVTQTISFDIKGIPEYSHLGRIDALGLLICCRPILVGCSVEKNLHLVQEKLTNRMLELEPFMATHPAECHDIVRRGLERSLGSTYLKGKIAEALRDCPQNSYLFPLVHVGHEFDDVDPRLFPGPHVCLALKLLFSVVMLAT